MADPENRRSKEGGGLLASRDAQPVGVTNPQGRSLFLLLGDHAGNRVPERLGQLGLPDADLQRHIALDLGVSQLGARLAASLDAPFVEQRYSRLVIDCNRALGSAGSIAANSDGTDVPGNAGLTQAQGEERAREIFVPYHDAITELLTRREQQGAMSIIVSLHSFTPRMDGVARPWQVGVLHGGGDGRFARAMLAALQAHGALVIGDNEPYRMDETDYTVPAHAFASARPYVEIEVRQDELATEARLEAIAGILQQSLNQAARTLSLTV
jgi:predicted N-formylglutamate amidohydrolase